ncbi:MAG: DUF4956 domain-containing protein [Proteobacteria bacterium]|nr:DUF4956 domain-containing protein [Pseudomonadota bacterium]
MPPEIAFLPLRFLLNLFCMGILVYGIYLPRRRSRDFAFTYMMLNIVTFSLAWLMNRVPMDLGFGLGMFAIFGILRYRTEALRIRDLTYLFVAIGLAVINGLESDKVPFEAVLFLDITTLLVVGVMEFLDARRTGTTVRLIYDRVDLLGPSQREELLADLETRLHRKCEDVEIGTIDLLKETAVVWVTLDGRP